MFANKVCFEIKISITHSPQRHTLIRNMDLWRFPSTLSVHGYKTKSTWAGAHPSMRIQNMAFSSAAPIHTITAVCMRSASEASSHQPWVRAQSTAGSSFYNVIMDRFLSGTKRFTVERHQFDSSKRKPQIASFSNNGILTDELRFDRLT